MSGILADYDAPLHNADRILELGCAAGRMTRWLANLDAEVWGVDIWSTAILWCQDNLRPLQFATTTMTPHLPFEDQSFDLVYCGSVFTHIDDLADTWFLELHRILRPGGRLYFTINDHHAVNIFDGNGHPGDYERFYERTGGKDAWDQFVAMIEAEPDYQRFRNRDAYMVTLGRSMSAHVMWDTDVLTDRLRWGYRLNVITPAAYGHQTTVLLERVPRARPATSQLRSSVSEAQ
jgi:SAM-dependent methyltransferase